MKERRWVWPWEEVEWERVGEREREGGGEVVGLVSLLAAEAIVKFNMGGGDAELHCPVVGGLPNK